MNKKINGSLIKVSLAAVGLLLSQVNYAASWVCVTGDTSQSGTGFVTAYNESTGFTWAQYSGGGVSLTCGMESAGRLSGQVNWNYTDSRFFYTSLATSQSTWTRPTYDKGYSMVWGQDQNGLVGQAWSQLTWQ